MEIVPLLAPTDEEVQAICAQVARRVLRRVEARLDDGVDLGDAAEALAPAPHEGSSSTDQSSSHFLPVQFLPLAQSRNYPRPTGS